jgi:hypothetical protein
MIANCLNEKDRNLFQQEEPQTVSSRMIAGFFIHPWIVKAAGLLQSGLLR